MNFSLSLDPMTESFNFIYLPNTLRIRTPALDDRTVSIHIFVACFSLCSGELLLEDSVGESDGAQGKSSD